MLLRVMVLHRAGVDGTAHSGSAWAVDIGFRPRPVTRAADRRTRALRYASVGDRIAREPDRGRHRIQWRARGQARAPPKNPSTTPRHYSAACDQDLPAEGLGEPVHGGAGTLGGDAAVDVAGDLHGGVAEDL